MVAYERENERQEDRPHITRPQTGHPRHEWDPEPRGREAKIDELCRHPHGPNGGEIFVGIVDVFVKPLTIRNVATMQPLLGGVEHGEIYNWVVYTILHKILQY